MPIQCSKSTNLVNADKQKNLSRKCIFCKSAIADTPSALNRKCTFCKSAIADKPPALIRIALFSKVPIRCIKSVNSVSANKQKNLNRKCTF